MKGLRRQIKQRVNLCHRPVNPPPRPHFSPMQHKLLFNWTELCHIHLFLSILKLPYTSAERKCIFNERDGSLWQSPVASSTRRPLQLRASKPNPEGLSASGLLPNATLRWLASRFRMSDFGFPSAFGFRPSDFSSPCP